MTQNKTPEEIAIEDEYRRVAKSQSRDGELEVDDDALVSMGADPGAYVQAWIWVPLDDTDICRECGQVDRSVTNGEGYDGMCSSCTDKAFAKDENYGR